MSHSDALDTKPKKRAGNAITRNLARPYAKAAFEYAKQNQQVAAWSSALSLLADVMLYPTVQAVVESPATNRDALDEALIAAVGQVFSNEGIENFIHLLAQNRRLLILPEIFQSFEAYRAAHEKVIHVQLVLAHAISNEQQRKLEAALKIRLQQNVKLDWEQDSRLLGGAVIKVGDLVIDGSVKSALSRLFNRLAQP